MSAELPSGPLENARLLTGLTVAELWVRYSGNGGSATETEFRSFLEDRPWPDELQYDIAVSALNDRFHEMDLDHPLPYAAPPAG